MTEFIVKPDGNISEPSSAAGDDKSASVTKKENTLAADVVRPSVDKDESAKESATIQDIINKSKYGVETPRSVEGKSTVKGKKVVVEKDVNQKGIKPWVLIILIVMVIVDIILGIVSYLYFNSR